MRSLVTGAYGFVGANLVRRLLAGGHEVHALGRPGSDAWRLGGLETEVAVREADLTHEESVGRLMAEVRPQWVFHLAAHGAYSWQTGVRPALEVNAIGTALLAEAASAAGVEALVHAGTSSEYGLQPDAPPEARAPAPNSAYAVGKLAATAYCSHVARRDGRRMVTLRLYSVYGPYEEPGRLVPTLVARGLEGALPPLVDPRTARDFVYAGDVCDAFLRAAEADVEPGAVFNIGSGRQTTIGELVESARRVLGIAAEPAWGGYAARDWDTNAWVSDPSRAERELGWTAGTPIDDGLRLTAEWMRTAPAAAGRYAA
jgi:nucleoside-diphosphate-sugar epimerase